MGSVTWSLGRSRRPRHLSFGIPTCRFSVAATFGYTGCRRLYTRYPGLKLPQSREQNRWARV